MNKSISFFVMIKGGANLMTESVAALAKIPVSLSLATSYLARE